MMNEQKKMELIALIESFDKKAQNVETRLQELKVEKQTLQAQCAEAKVTYETVVAQVSMGANGYSNKNIIESKKKLSQLHQEFSDMEDLIATLESAKNRELSKIVPPIEKAFQEFASMYNNEVLIVSHDKIHEAKIRYLGSIANVQELEKFPAELLQTVHNVRRRAGITEENRNLRYYAPTLNMGIRGSLGENDQIVRIEPSEIADTRTKLRVLPRVYAFVKYGKIILKSLEAEAFIKSEESKKVGDI